MWALQKQGKQDNQSAKSENQIHSEWTVWPSFCWSKKDQNCVLSTEQNSGCHISFPAPKNGFWTRIEFRRSSKCLAENFSPNHLFSMIHNSNHGREKDQNGKFRSEKNSGCHKVFPWPLASIWSQKDDQNPEKCLAENFSLNQTVLNQFIFKVSVENDVNHTARRSLHIGCSLKCWLATRIWCSSSRYSPYLIILFGLVERFWKHSKRIKHYKRQI